MTKVIGLTGGIGSGKSTVARLLAEMGAVIIDADKVGHEAFRPGTPAYRDVIAAFGADILTAQQEINRKKLGQRVFQDPEALARLNRIMHPRMRDMMRAQLDECRRRNVPVVVLEAAILIEASWKSLVDEVWVTIAPEANVLARVKEQRGLPESDTLARIRSQMTAEARIKHADVVISNDGSLEQLREKVQTLWAKLDKKEATS